MTAHTEAPGRTPLSRSTWHLRAGAIVGAWLLAVLVVAVAHPFVPASRWLLVHLLLLGAASNAILIWSSHFAAALLHLPGEQGRRGDAARLITFNAGAVAVVAGMLAQHWTVVLSGGIVVAVAAGWHAAALLRRMRRALPSRFGVTVRYYVASGVLLPAGVALGVVMARGGLADAVHARVVVAHSVVNLLGWIGLTVVGTLITLWPTMLRTRVADSAERAARHGLPVLLAGVGIAAEGSLAGSRPLLAAGALVYLGGLAVAGRTLLDPLRRRPPASFATWSVLAGLAWFAGSLVALTAWVTTAPDWVAAAERAGWLTAPLLAGFAAQVLLGALSYLLPVVIGGGPHVVRAANTVFDRAWPARVTAANTGLLVSVLPVPSLVRVLASVVVLVALASFLPLAVRAARTATRLRNQPDPPALARPGGTQPPDPYTDARRAGGAVAGLAAVVLAVAAGVAADPVALGVSGAEPADGGVAASGETTTVTVEARGMRFFPDTVEVPAGNRLVIELANEGADMHDLVLETGDGTGRLAPGESATLDVGIVGRDLDGWCSVAGHRQLGMVLTIKATGAGEGDDPHAGHDHGGPGDAPAAGRDAAGDEGSAAADLDLMAEPGPGFTPYDAELAPAEGARIHRVTLTVSESNHEVAPGVRQTRWTFGGTAPGPTLRGKVGDTFEITLVNDGTIGHSIDFHAGALAPQEPMRTIQPGESLIYRFTATRSGIWMYHCSTAPISLHIANGMFGAVIIDPPDLPPVDREYVLVQSELYLGPQGGIADTGRIADESPDLVVFNGHATQYAAEPLTARLGERVRIWVLAAGPNRGSAFHVVGGQFDTVYQEGAYLLEPAINPAGGSQVLGLAPAQGGFVELTFPEPGDYPFVSHLMVDAERGARGVFQVTR